MINEKQIYIRAVDEDLNEILLSKDLKKEYCFDKKRVWGNKDKRDSSVFGIFITAFSYWLLGNYIGYWSIPLGFIAGFGFNYFIMPKNIKVIKEKDWRTK